MANPWDDFKKPDVPPWEAYAAQVKPVKDLGAVRAFLEHAGNQLALGYAPQLQAKAAPAVYGLLNKFTGQNIQPDDYLTERDSNIERIANEQQQHPDAALSGSVAGALAGAMALPGAGPSKTILGAAGKNLLLGAGLGAVSNPGDTKGVIDEAQIEPRLENAKSGAIVGAAAGAGSKIVEKLAQALSNSPEILNNTAETQAFRSAGPYKREFATALERKQVNPIGRFMLDNGLIQAGDSVEDVARKAGELRQSAGNRLDDVYTQAKSAFPGLETKVGLNPASDKKAILDAAANDLGDSVDRSSALKKLSDYFDELAERYTDTVDARKTNDIKGALDEKIRYTRNPLMPEPASETAFSSARDAISKKVDDAIEATGGGDLVDNLKSANRDYGFSKNVEGMAKNRLSGDRANRMLSLTDTIAGTGGAAVGGAVGHLAGGGDYRTTAKDAAAYGLLAALTNKAGRTYGPGLLATSANLAAKVAPYSAAPIGDVIGALSPQRVGQALIPQMIPKSTLKKPTDERPPWEVYQNMGDR